MHTKAYTTNLLLHTCILTYFIFSCCILVTTPPQKAYATRIEEINIAKLPTWNNKQKQKQRANKEKSKTSTIILIATIQPQATTSAAATTLRQFRRVTANGCPIFHRITFVNSVYKKLSLDAMHLYIVEIYLSLSKMDQLYN